jgi:hypothetical protein
VDASETSHNYLFGSSIVTVTCIRDMASLHYFVEGDAREPEEYVISRACR